MKTSSSSGDVDLLFVALHQTSLQCSQKSFMRYQMSRGLYFYDQYTRVSHLGGLHRYKRHPEELNQALHYVRVALAAEDNESAKIETPATTINPTPSLIKSNVIKQTNERLLRTIQRKLNAPIVPDVLFKELDLVFEKFEDKSKTALSSSTTKILSSIPSKSSQAIINEDEGLETEPITIQEAEDEDELIAANTNIPKVSLPASLIIFLHSTWTDLIQNTDYNYKVWRTKVGEDSWNRHVERKRLEEMNSEKQRIISISKQGNRRTNSRASITSIKNLSNQQYPLTANPQMRSNRSLSRVSFISANHISQLENNRFIKPIHQGSLESLNESVKSGIHVEFKLSTQIDQTKQQQQSYIQALNQQKGVMFDVPKPSVDVHEDVIALIQAKCKRLLAEMKQKILSLGDQNSKMCTIWFYGENQHIRNKTNLLTLNESARRQKSKFIFSILRREIPDKYHIEIDIPENKHKSYMELIDGSIQIYYPSGRLAVLRFNYPNFTTIFFDDTDIEQNQFLGLVTSNGNIFIMQPTLHARFTTDHQHQCAYLCQGKTGIIQKQLLYHFNQSQTHSILSNQTISNHHDDEDILPPLFQNTVQLQLNPYMQLEFYNPTNIRFAFVCQKEEFKFQLGTNRNSIQSPTLIEPTITPTKKVFNEKKSQLKSKLATVISNSTNLNDLSNISDKQRIQIERLLDGQINLKELPMIKELIFLRKKIRHICINWLKQCRITLGVMDIQSYCLPDWPTTTNQLIVPILKTHQSKSAKSSRHVSISTKPDSSINEFLQPNEKEQILRTLSARKSHSNIIRNTMIEFNRRSNNSGKSIQQKIYQKKKISSTFLPTIKIESSIPIINEENSSMNIINPLDVPFACPNLIRQRLIENVSILNDKCTCRVDHVPLIHDLEFDKFIQLTNDFNSKQLIVIGIINSNLRQIDNEQSNHLYEILQTLHHHLNYGRSQISLCRLSTNDDYRCFIYDLSEATKQSSFYGPLLVRRHHVQPGFLLIYQHGKLIFGDFIFNGYGRNILDLKKQLNHIKQQQIQQTALPDQFKFKSNQQHSNTTVFKSV